MPIYTRKEFKQTFNLSTQYLSTNIARGKLVLSGKYIDSEVSENKAWLEDWHLKNGIAESIGFPEAEAIPKGATRRRTKEEIKVPGPSRKKPEDFDIPEASGGPVDVGNMSRTELDVALKKINIKKAQEDLELARIKKQKLLGLVIPTDLVFGVFARHFKSITDSFYQATDNILIETIPERKDLGIARAKLVDIVNDAVNSAKENSKKEINGLLAEYSESRGKGESK